jgi:hypothetical protein
MSQGPADCPACERKNGPHRQACMYCGAELPQQEAVATPENIGDRFEAMLRGDPSSADAAGEHIPETAPPALAAQMLGQVLPAPPDPPLGPTLPPARKPYLLVVDAGGRQTLAPLLAERLGVDGVTAAMLVRSRVPRVASWSESRQDLEAVAARLVDVEGLSHSVLFYGDLREREAARQIEGMEGGDLLVEGGERVSLSDMALAVVGSVVIRRFRMGRDTSRWSHRKGKAQREMGERRVDLIDFYGCGRCYRLAVGSTDFQGFPGFTEGRVALSYKRLVELLPSSQPRMRVVEKRICHPQGSAPLPRDGEMSAEQEHTGWPQWLEHSRICCLHYLS